MDIAFCYEKVFPAKGGCETYIADLARRLVADGHTVHLYACCWDESALPPGLRYHPLPAPRGPRFLRAWRFGAACARALEGGGHEVSVGFNKTWGQDVLYPQGGLHVASVEHNLRKYPGLLTRGLARTARALDLAHWSFSRLERRQYLGPDRPLVVVNSHMVRRHFQRHYGIDPEGVRVVHAAVDPARLEDPDRPALRRRWREHWGARPGECVGLFVAMNYRLKGLEPLLHAVARLRGEEFRLLVVGQPRTHGFERLARRLGVSRKVCFAGPRRDVQNCYFAADFLVHPTFYDPCSLVVLEALTCGLPVITTGYNGAGELLSPLREGYLIEDPHDHDHLAWCMRQLLDPDRREACAREARRTGARWSFDHHYRLMLEVFAEAAARKHGAVPRATPARSEPARTDAGAEWPGEGAVGGHEVHGPASAGLARASEAGRHGPRT